MRRLGILIIRKLGILIIRKLGILIIRRPGILIIRKLGILIIRKLGILIIRRLGILIIRRPGILLTHRRGIHILPLHRWRIIPPRGAVGIPITNLITLVEYPARTADGAQAIAALDGPLPRKLSCFYSHRSRLLWLDHGGAR
jgi:hypothetical protein